MEYAGLRPVEMDADEDEKPSRPAPLPTFARWSRCSPPSGTRCPATIHVPTGELPAEAVFDAYLRATCVAAGIGYDPAFLDRITGMFQHQQRNADDA